MVNQDLEWGFKFADAFFCGVCCGSPSQIDWMRRAGEEEKVCGSWSISKFISRWCCDRGQGKVYRSSIHQASQSPTISLRLRAERQRREGAGGWQFIRRITAFLGSEERKGSGGSDSSHSQERSQMWAVALFTSAFRSYWGEKMFFLPRVCSRLTAEMAPICHPSHTMCNVTWWFCSSRGWAYLSILLFFEHKLPYNLFWPIECNNRSDGISVPSLGLPLSFPPSLSLCLFLFLSLLPSNMRTRSASLLEDKRTCGEEPSPQLRTFQTNEPPANLQTNHRCVSKPCWT